MLRTLSRFPFRPLTLALAGWAALACGGDDPAAGPRGGGGAALTYYADAKAIVDARCATCHSAGNIGPFTLTSYDDVERYAVPMRAAIALGTMPPWQPSDECNDYADNFDLSDDERQTLLDFLDQGAPEGDPGDAPEDTGAELPSFEADLSLQLPEAYTPVREPDDYRCQLIDWPAEETRYVTGLRVSPDRRDLVHHVIVFLAGPEQAEEFRAFDEAEEGPGYTCYGGPRPSDAGGALAGIDPATLFAALDELGITLAELQAGELSGEQTQALLDAVGAGSAVSSFNSLGSWVPGTPAGPYPEGTGIRVEPGSVLVAQIHYNTLSSAPA
ncbi:MAG: cytochrome c, partial [Myxococcota bacterium]